MIDLDDRGVLVDEERARKGKITAAIEKEAVKNVVDASDFWRSAQYRQRKAVLRGEGGKSCCVVGDGTRSNLVARNVGLPSSMEMR